MEGCSAESVISACAASAVEVSATAPFEVPLDAAGHHATCCSRPAGSSSRRNALGDHFCTLLRGHFVSLRCQRGGYFATERHMPKHKR